MSPLFLPCDVEISEAQLIEAPAGGRALVVGITTALLVVAGLMLGASYVETDNPYGSYLVATVKG